jgi:hypothetical protein
MTVPSFREGLIELCGSPLATKALHMIVQRRACMYISNAMISGGFALRACIVDHRTTPADVEEVVTVGRNLFSGTPN